MHMLACTRASSTLRDSGVSIGISRRHGCPSSFRATIFITSHRSMLHLSPHMQLLWLATAGRRQPTSAISAREAARHSTLLPLTRPAALRALFQTDSLDRNRKPMHTSHTSHRARSSTIRSINWKVSPPSLASACGRV